ncbi:hypothetical protein LOD99_4160 [Oopsacas minuta]|uniref:Uncharacterized protein n=1 Tax=Oopsacas minuta TaxID=111878 RepID=A0AAV7JVW0_9METZ|nr:hypothetical protein LOD99_4160 [Oopsacas minuta]
MGNNLSNSGEVVYCGLFTQFQVKSSMRYSQMVEDESLDILSEHWKLTSDELSREIRSFAKVEINSLATEKYVCVIVIPYFGNLAGREVYFYVFKNNTIEIHLGRDNKLQLFDPLLCTKDFKLRCLEFTYDSRLQSVHTHDGEKIVQRDPCRLSFLCERTILLNLETIPIMNLPYNLSYSLTSSGYLDLTIYTWPNYEEKNKIISLRVKRNILVKELEWMICHKLPHMSPQLIKLYHNCRHLTSEKTVDIDTLKIDCVIKLSQEVACTVHTSPVVALVIMFAGRGSYQINMHLSSQLQELDKKIRELCDIPNKSFLYIPSVMPSSDLKLCLNLNVQGSLNLLDPESRAFPLVGHKYNFSADELYSKLPVYKWPIEELGIIEQLGITVFEITGPTIPIIFRQCYTLCDATTIENVNNERKSATAVSVNYQWSLDTLFLYINMISGFPGIQGISCKDYYTDINNYESNTKILEKFEFFQEVVRNIRKRRALKVIPQIIYSFKSQSKEF